MSLKMLIIFSTFWGGVKCVSEMAQSQGVIKDTIAGGFGGMCLVLVGHPLDTIKGTAPLKQSSLPATFSLTSA